MQKLKSKTFARYEETLQDINELEIKLKSIKDVPKSEFMT